MPAAEKDVPLIKTARYWFDWAVSVLGVADANILGLTTIDGTSTTTSLIGMIGAKACHENLIPARRQCREAMLGALNAQAFGATESASNTAIAAADTVAGVRALFNTAVPALSATLSELPSHGPLPLGPLRPLAP